MNATTFVPENPVSHTNTFNPVVIAMISLVGFIFVGVTLHYCFRYNEPITETQPLDEEGVNPMSSQFPQFAQYKEGGRLHNI